jgi:dimeric dUTPase (all-alpha-NTP-PPase superfamily)
MKSTQKIGVPPQKDKLEFLFQEQLRLTRKLGKTHNKMRSLYQIPEAFEGYRIFMLSSAMIHEIVELQRETNWKWWKTPRRISADRCKEEIIDIWHFLIQLSIELGVGPTDLLNQYSHKHKINIDRQRKGY